MQADQRANEATLANLPYAIFYGNRGYMTINNINMIYSRYLKFLSLICLDIQVSRYVFVYEYMEIYENLRHLTRGVGST
jgi:hypothetical protein